MTRKYAAAGLALSAFTVLAPSVARAQVFRLTPEQLVQFTAQNPFERFPDGRPKIPAGMLERARNMSAEEVWAVLPGKGFRQQYEGGFRVLHPGRSWPAAPSPCNSCPRAPTWTASSPNRPSLAV